MAAVTLKVWFPGLRSGKDPASLTLETPMALRFFLEAVYRGNSIVDDETFYLEARQAGRVIGSGTYRVTHQDTPELEIVEEQPEGLDMRASWNSFLEDLRRIEREKTL